MVSVAGLVGAIGIIHELRLAPGDLVSVVKAFVKDSLHRAFLVGSLSLLFWSLSILVLDEGCATGVDLLVLVNKGLIVEQLGVIERDWLIEVNVSG